MRTERAVDAGKASLGALVVVAAALAPAPNVGAAGAPTAAPAVRLRGQRLALPPDGAPPLTHLQTDAPLSWKLTPHAREKLRNGNHERLFDEARPKVRARQEAVVN